MMSLTVLVSTLLPLPSPSLPPPSSCLSVSLLCCRHSEKTWEWQEEGEEEETEEERGGRRRRSRAAVRESEFFEFSHRILPFTTAGTLSSLFFSIPVACCSDTSVSSWNLQQEKHDFLIPKQEPYTVTDLFHVLVITCVLHFRCNTTS